MRHFKHIIALWWIDLMYAVETYRMARRSTKRSLL